MEDKTIIELNKERIESIREEMFKSSGGCYVKPAVLSAISYALTNSKAASIMSDKKMMTSMKPVKKIKNVKKLKKHFSSRITNRQTHVSQVGEVAKIIAEKLGLNSNLAEIIGKYHDIGHCFNGHEGENIISTIAENYGFGYRYHNALGVEVILKEINLNDIYKSAHKNDSSVTEEEVEKALWIVLDGILCHNGETTQSSLKPNPGKTTENIKKDYKNCYIYEHYDRTLTPKTREAAIVKFADIICYDVSDFLDGHRKGLLKSHDVIKEYMSCFEKFGITESWLLQFPKNERKQRIVNEIKNVLIEDLVKNSKDKNDVGLSKEMSDAMYELRNLNYENIIKKCGTKYELYHLPRAVRKLHYIFSEAIKTSDYFKEFFVYYKNPNNSKFKGSDWQKEIIKKVINSISPERMDGEDRKEFKELIKNALNVAIDEDIKLAIALNEDNTEALDKNQIKKFDKFKVACSKNIVNSDIKLNRINMFKADIENKYKRNPGESVEGYTTRVLKEYKPIVMDEINLSEEESREKYKEEIKKRYKNTPEPKRSKKIIKKLKVKEPKDRLLTFEEILALALASRYISGCSNKFIKRIISKFKLLNKAKINDVTNYENERTKCSTRFARDRKW